VAEEAMNVRGPCSSCGATLASDQRYCVECGQRVGPPLALPYALPPAAPPPAAGSWLAALPMPAQMVSAFAALALGFGAVVGTAISPNLRDILAAPSPPVVAEAPPAAPPVSTAGGGGGAPTPSGGAPPALAASTTSTAGIGSGPGGGGGGGGGGKKKKKKKKPAPTTFAGVVVRVNPVAESYTLASGNTLTSIHAGSLPRVGDRVEAPVRKLKNTTYAEDGARTQQGTADQTSFSGTVTYCADLDDPSAVCDGSVPESGEYVYSVSHIGSSILVRIPGSPPAAAPPPVGSVVDVGIRIDPFSPPAPPDPPRDDPSPCNPGDGEANGRPNPPITPTANLVQTSLTIRPPPAQLADLEAVVQAICPGQVVLSADDIREGGRDLLPIAAPGLDLSRLQPGQAVYANVEVGSDAAHTLTLRGITSDHGLIGADDPSQGQGTLTGL
jgi:hypothetical protein